VTRGAPECHPSAGGGIEHPRRHHDDHAGRHLDVNDLAAGALLDILAPNAAPIERVPAIMNLDLVPDMGRMTGRLRSAAKIISSPVRMPEVDAAAAMYSLIESAKLNGINPQHYLADVLARIADHPARHIAELLPWNWQPISAARAAA
jgi:hypothetical protein